MRTIWIYREAAYDWTEKWGQAENGGQVFRADGKLQERNRMWEYGFLIVVLPFLVRQI
jgi:hypothetical protein